MLHQLKEQQLDEGPSQPTASTLGPRRNVSLPARLSSPEKRGLPPNTMRLVDFAKHHQITVGTIKAFYYQHAIQLEIYKRQTPAIRNKQEWWITPEQHLALAQYLQKQDLAYKSCSICEEQEQPIM